MSRLTSMRADHSQSEISRPVATEVEQKLIAFVPKIFNDGKAFSYSSRKLRWDSRLVKADDHVNPFANTFRRKLRNNFVALEKD